MKLSRRAPLCHRLQCMTLPQHIAAVRELTAITAPPRKIAFDGPFTKWATAYGEWWAPPARLDFMEKLVHEIRMDVYGLGTDRAGQVVIDGGANIGMFARQALLAGAEKVICFEPAPKTIEALRRNLQADIECGRVVIVSKALWSDPGKALFAIPAGDAGSDQIVQAEGVRGADSSIEVELTSVDVIVREMGLARVDFIKIDVEGAEAAAIQGAAETLSQFQPIVSIATEHTEDVLANNRAVLDALAVSAPTFKTRCMECHAERSVSFGGAALTPYVLKSAPCL